MGNAKVTASASAASGDARPRAFISFLLSRKIAPALFGLTFGPVRSSRRFLSRGMDAVESQSYSAPHISARLLPYIAGLLDFHPKLTPRTL